MAIERHLQEMRTLNANRHLERSITFEAIICEVLLYDFLSALTWYNFVNVNSKVYRSTRYVFIHCLWLKIEFYVNLKPWIIDPAISNANLETLAKLDTF